jgi:serine/threonine-protein kinase HipA
MHEPVLMGELRAESVRGKEIFSFTYYYEWLKTSTSQNLDPQLFLFSGAQYASDEKTNFGVFLDSSPDRWGRMLMKRREAALARSERRPEMTLRESDYLLGVFDGHRMGALRFKEDPGGPFLNNNEDFASPPWTSLKELEQISLRLEDEDAIDDPGYMKWLTMLVNPGSSLGGARPKASILDDSKKLWIAKFPGRSDTMDIGGWEMVANELARSAGINVAHSMVKSLSGRYHTFLTKRFDRSDNGERIHFASAMTMLGHKDGNSYREGASYLEVADFLASQGASVDSDLQELWTRIVFNIMIANTDDHLRNHGFLMTKKGWILSPAYDLNPEENSTGLSLNISLTDNALDPELALEVIEFFRMDRDRGVRIVERLKESVSRWRRVADRYKLPRSEQERMARVFDRFI